jgi:hypothetical protein
MTKVIGRFGGWWRCHVRNQHVLKFTTGYCARCGKDLQKWPIR